MSDIELIKQQIIKRINDNTISLPSLPAVILHIEKKLNDDGASMGDIANVIQNEITLSSRLLQVSNSPALKANTKIISIKDALSRIGLNMVKNLIITINLRDKFVSTNAELQKYLFDIFEESIELAFCAYQVSRRYSKDLRFNSDLVNLTGIIYNLGKLPVISYFEQTGFDDIETVKEVAEKLRNTFNHTIINKWDIDFNIAEAITRNSNKPLTRDIGNLLHIVDIFLRGENDMYDKDDDFMFMIWNDLANHVEDDMIGANEIQRRMVS